MKYLIVVIGIVLAVVTTVYSCRCIKPTPDDAICGSDGMYICKLRCDLDFSAVNSTSLSKFSALMLFLGNTYASPCMLLTYNGCPEPVRPASEQVTEVHKGPCAPAMFM